MIPAAGFSAIIQQVAPTAVVSDIPGILSSALPGLETLAAEELTGLIPPGLVPSEVVAQIPTVVSEILPAVASEIDAAIITGLPATLSLAALPGALESNLPAVESQIVGAVSEAIPEASSVLVNADPLVSSLTAGGSGALPTGLLPTAGTGSLSIVPTPTSSLTPVYTGAASKDGWRRELVGAAGVVAAVAML